MGNRPPPMPENPLEIRKCSGEIVSCGKNLIDMDYLLEYFQNKLGYNAIVKESNGDYKLAFSTTGYDINSRIIIPIAFPKTPIRVAFQCEAIISGENKWWATEFFIVFEDGTYKSLSPAKNHEIFEKFTYVMDKPKVIKHLCFNSANGASYPVWVRNVQLEILEDGQTEPSPYEPFHGIRTQKLELLSVPQYGWKDTLTRQEDGSYLLRKECQYFEMTGEELEWSQADTTSKGTHYVNYYYREFGPMSTSNFTNLICSRLPSERMADGNDNVGIEKCYEGWSKSAFYRMRLPIDTLDEFKNKLKEWRRQKKPLAIVSKKLTPEYKKIYLTPLPTYEGVTNIYFASEIAPSSFEAKLLTTEAINEKLEEGTKNVLEKISNPNLLFNSDFRKLINSTGTTEWNFSSPTYTTIFDGWEVNYQNNGGFIHAKDNFIVLNNNSGATGAGYLELKQYLPISSKDLKNIRHDNIHFSWSIEENQGAAIMGLAYQRKSGATGVIKEITVRTNFPTFQTEGLDLGRTANYDWQEGDKAYFYFVVSPNYAAKVKWLKLEIGDKVTPLEYIPYTYKSLTRREIMSVSKWSGKAYSFETQYPKIDYDIEIAPDATCSLAQYDAFTAAKLAGSADNNIYTAIGEVPKVDIPINVKIIYK